MSEPQQSFQGFSQPWPEYSSQGDGQIQLPSHDEPCIIPGRPERVGTTIVFKGAKDAQLLASANCICPGQVGSKVGMTWQHSNGADDRMSICRDYKGYYQLLGLDGPSASLSTGDIAKAFRQAALRSHPDRIEVRGARSFFKRCRMDVVLSQQERHVLRVAERPSSKYVSVPSDDGSTCTDLRAALRVPDCILIASISPVGQHHCMLCVNWIHAMALHNLGLGPPCMRTSALSHEPCCRCCSTSIAV